MALLDVPDIRNYECCISSLIIMKGWAQWNAPYVLFDWRFVLS